MTHGPDRDPFDDSFFDDDRLFDNDVQETATWWMAVMVLVGIILFMVKLAIVLAFIAALVWVVVTVLQWTGVLMLGVVLV